MMGVVSMGNAAPVPAIEHDPQYYLLKQEIEEFLYYEADLLDGRRFKDWLMLFSDDVVYFMPIRRNVESGQHDQRENTRLGQGISWFEEDKWTLTKRVEQILTGLHVAEEPLSRICHMVSNVRLLDIRPHAFAPSEVTAKSRFLVYQNRIEYETYIFVGKRTDVLRKTNDGWKIAKREIVLDQNILLAKNLTTFF